MSINKAYLTRCPECGQKLLEEASQKCYGCGYKMVKEDRYEEWVNEDDPWYEDPFDDIC